MSMWAKIALVETCDSTTLEINCTIQYLGWNFMWPCNFKAVPKMNQTCISAVHDIYSVACRAEQHLGDKLKLLCDCRLLQQDERLF